MALVIADRVFETSNTTSTGTFSLLGAQLGYRTFLAGVGGSNTTYYSIANAGLTEWETGLGTVSSDGTTLARNTVLASSNAGSLVNFSAGTKSVFCDVPASKVLYLDGSGNAPTLLNAILTTPTVNTPTITGGTITGTTLNNATLGVTTPAAANVSTLRINSTLSLLGSTGTTNQVLISQGTNPPIWGSANVAQGAGGSSGQVQYNNGGILSGSANLTFNGTTLAANTITENGYAVLSQKDVGTAPNQVPLNQYLGKLAFQDVLDTVSNNPYQDTQISDVEPTLNLDFVNSKTLDSRITFTRSTTATYYGPNISALAEQNLYTYSQQIGGTNWQIYNALTIALSSTDYTDPAGGNTYTKLTNSSASKQSIYQVIASATGYVGSFYVHAGTATYLGLDNGGATSIWFNLTGSGSVAQTNAGTGTITLVSAGVYRITYIPSGATTLPISISLPNGVGVTTQNIGETAYVTFAQAEIRSSATAYNATTTQALTNYIPTLQTAAINQARLDYNPVTGTPNGLLIEEARTNLLTYSQDFTNSVWYKDGTTITATANIAPDGTQTASKIIASATSARHHARQDYATASLSTNTFSCYAKAGEYKYIALSAIYATNSAGFCTVFDLTNGNVTQSTNNYSTPTINTATAVGNGWWRLSVTGTNTAGVILGSWAINPCPVATPTIEGSRYSPTYTGDGFSGVYAWGAQLEAGAFPTSYIPTVASQVTRSADSATITGTNFSSWYNQAQGSFYASYLNSQPYTGTIPILGGNSNPFILYRQGSMLKSYNAVTGGISIGFTDPYVPNAFMKASITYSNQNRTALLAENGVSISSSGLFSPTTDLGIGYNSNYGYLNGWIQKVQYYPIALSSAELQEMTS